MQVQQTPRLWNTWQDLAEKAKSSWSEKKGPSVFCRQTGEYKMNYTDSWMTGPHTHDSIPVPQVCVCV